MNPPEQQRLQSGMKREGSEGGPVQGEKEKYEETGLTDRQTKREEPGASGEAHFKEETVSHVKQAGISLRLSVENRTRDLAFRTSRLTIVIIWGGAGDPDCNGMKREWGVTYCRRWKQHRSSWKSGGKGRKLVSHRSEGQIKGDISSEEERPECVSCSLYTLT